MSTKNIKSTKLVKAYYTEEIMKITVPESPIARSAAGSKRITAAVLSFTLVAASLFLITSAYVPKLVPSPLARQISICAESVKWDEAFMDGFDHLKTAYNQKHKEEQ